MFTPCLDLLENVIGKFKKKCLKKIGKCEVFLCFNTSERERERERERDRERVRYNDQERLRRRQRWQKITQK